MADSWLAATCRGLHDDPVLADRRVSFRLLGAFAVYHDGRPVKAGHARQQDVLAVLLIEAGQRVPIRRITERVWGLDGDDNLVYTYVSRLRGALRDTGTLIEKDQHGYTLMVNPVQVDLHRYRVVLAQPAHDVDQAEKLLSEAEQMWQSTPFTASQSDWLRAFGQELAEQRLDSCIERHEVMLAGGRHTVLTGRLTALADAYPADERLAAQLMLALYRNGQTAKATGHYEVIRRMLRDSGLEPGPRLRRLHRQMLLEDDSLDWRAENTNTAATVVPAVLPRDVAPFVGRGSELAVLNQYADRESARKAVLIVSIEGTAGVGKTALATHWAHQIRARHTGGCLYADLGAYGSSNPADPGSVLGEFLISLGVAPQRIPEGTNARKALYQSLLDKSKILIILDNAATAEQVRALVPGGAGSLVIVTSRHTLAGLVALDGARQLNLDALTTTEAAELLQDFVGDRADSEPAELAGLVEICARLPLALRVVGARAMIQPELRLAHLVAELSDPRLRLDRMRAGDDNASAVRQVLSWSYLAMPAAAARLFRLLGLHPGREISGAAAAALCGTDPSKARVLLENLASAHLLEQASLGRFTMHDLLRTYAADLAGHNDEATTRRAALTALFDHYLASAAAAVDAILPAESNRRPGHALSLPASTPAAASAALSFTDKVTAQGWLETERLTLLAIGDHAAAHGWPEHVVRLALILFRHLDHGGHLSELALLNERAVSAARRGGDRKGEAEALTQLAATRLRQGAYGRAGELLEQAGAIFEELSDDHGRYRVLGNLGRVSWRLGHHDAAISQQRQALAITRQLGERVGEARTLTNLGTVLEAQGDLAEAARAHRLSIDICRELNLHDGVARGLGNLANVQHQQGLLTEAGEGHLQALQAFRDLGDRVGEATALTNLAIVQRDLGNSHHAIDLHQQALAIFQEIGNRTNEIEVCNDLGYSLIDSGKMHHARGSHTSALRLAREIADHGETARAHIGLAQIAHALEEPERLAEHLHAAQTAYAQLGQPEPARLAALRRAIGHQ